MTEWLLRYEIIVRLSAFFGVLGLMAVWEYLAPRRELTASKTVRWLNNIALVFLNSLLLRLIMPMAAVALAVQAEQYGWGLFNYWLLPDWLPVLLCIILLDAAIYLQHVMFHAVPAFWRLHRMHHADVDIDVTTGARFHPVEILLSMLFKFAVIVTLGVPPLAVLLFEIVLNASAMFNHSNIALPTSADRWLRWLIVTPDMHRVHHSVHEQETNSNFGFNLSLWDRLCGTYQPQPQDGHETMRIGLNDFREPRYAWLPWLLIQPLLGSKPGRYTINQRNW